MATGGIFQLITNDGKQDRMLMATALLNKRLLEIERMRAQNPQIKDPTPTLVDIERTHVLFMNAHFKPFAAIGYEYNKVAVQSGSARLNSEVTFSIPQFGDFFNDMVLHVKLGAVDAVNAAYWTTGPHVADGSELLSYVDYVGQRLCQKVQFTVNGNPLDEYDSDVLNFHNDFFITPNKRVGWDRDVGQEVAHKGHENVLSANGRAGRGAGVRLGLEVFDGPQTPKPSQPELELWIPLLFWFNKDCRLSIPSVSIPYGQRFINVTLARADQLIQHLHAFDPALDFPGQNPVPVPDVTTCELFINNIFVNPEIHDIFIKRIGFSLIRVHRRQTIRTSKAIDNLLLNQLKWPVETIYCGLRPTDNIDVGTTKMLTAWDLYSKVDTLSVDACGVRDYSLLTAVPAAATYAAVDAVLLLKSASGRALLPFASLLPALSGTVTVLGLNEWLGYYGFERIPSAAAVATAANILAAWPQPTTAAGVGAGTGANKITYDVCTPVAKTLGIEAHGVPLYRDFPAQFFNTYTPYNYGGSHINTPDDCGAYMIPFNLYPGS